MKKICMLFLCVFMQISIVCAQEEKKKNEKSAQPAPGTFLAICKTEIAKYCSKRPDQNSNETRACLLSNPDKISKACEKIVFDGQAVSISNISISPECVVDTTKLCTNHRGSVVLSKCLKENYSKLSDDCKNTQDTVYKNFKL